MTYSVYTKSQSQSISPLLYAQYIKSTKNVLIEMMSFKYYLVTGSEREDKVDSTPVFFYVCVCPSPDNTQTLTPKN